MTLPGKIRVMVLYGGRSGEHEVSLRSAASIMRHLDRDRFEIVPVAIDKKGRWLLHDVSLLENIGEAVTVQKTAAPVLLPPDSTKHGLMPMQSSGGSIASIDVVFPAMHGTFCEDGTIQGLLELADMPYVGCGVLASAVGMDKEVAKRLIRDAGLPIVPYVSLKKDRWLRTKKDTAAKIARELGFPCFVKPSNSGSSVGVHKVKEASQLDAALEDAFKYDVKVLVEKAINAREIELAGLENSEPGADPMMSVPGEIIPHHEFYSYDAKYIDDNGAGLQIPAKLSPEQTARVQQMAREIFNALECEGMTRIDLFMDKDTGEFYFNEVNTIPGFTSISMYPKMWEASGISYKELLSRLIDLALARHQRKQALVREFQG